MESVRVTRSGELAVIALARGKVNALDPELISELRHAFGEIEADEGIAAVVLTGSGKFFSFGFDIPRFLDDTPEAFSGFLEEFTTLCRKIYLFPKPVVASLNGHTIAGGCMLANACDRRLMSQEHGKISLNEVTFGASVFASSVEILVSLVGARNAGEILGTGRMYRADEAVSLGLVDRAVPLDRLEQEAAEEARLLGGQDHAAWRSVKLLVRGPVAARFRDREAESIREFVELWYSPSTRRQLKRIEIR